MKRVYNTTDITDAVCGSPYRLEGPAEVGPADRTVLRVLPPVLVVPDEDEHFWTTWNCN